MTASHLPAVTTQTFDLPPIVQAMDRLNSYARSPGCDRHWELKDWIYALKSDVLGYADLIGCLTKRPIYVEANCGRCGGTGEDKHARYAYSCQVCDGNGITRLDFTESTIERTLRAWDWPLAPVRWHTPWRSMKRHDAELVADWKPRTPGRELTLDELLDTLHVVEAPAAFGRDWPERASRYSLYLGKSLPACAFCSAIGMEDHNYTTGRRGRLVWMSPVCPTCNKHWDCVSQRHGYIHQSLAVARLPMPKELLTPAVMRWIDSHGGLERVQARQPEMGGCYV